jgi:hypothetical protein
MPPRRGYGSAIPTGTHRPELVGRDCCSLAPLIGTRCEVSVGWGQARAYRFAK